MPRIQDAPVANKLNCIICKGSTRRNKPYCPRHVAEAPYVKWIVAQIEKQTAELRLVSRKQTSIFIEDDSLTLQEIINVLSYKGPKTIRGLSKEISLDPSITEHYVAHLRALDMVRVELNKRKNDRTVVLIEPDLASGIELI